MVRVTSLSAARLNTGNERPPEPYERGSGGRSGLWNTVPSVEACRPTLDVDERRNPQSAVGNGSDDEQSAGPLAEIAPLSSGHDILRIDDTGSRSRLYLTFAAAASSSRSQLPVETADAMARLTWDEPS